MAFSYPFWTAPFALISCPANYSYCLFPEIIVAYNNVTDSVRCISIGSIMIARTPNILVLSQIRGKLDVSLLLELPRKRVLVSVSRNRSMMGSLPPCNRFCMLQCITVERPWDTKRELTRVPALRPAACPITKSAWDRKLGLWQIEDNVDGRTDPRAHS